MWWHVRHSPTLLPIGEATATRPLLRRATQRPTDSMPSDPGSAVTKPGNRVRFARRAGRVGVRGTLKKCFLTSCLAALEHEPGGRAVPER